MAKKINYNLPFKLDIIHRDDQQGREYKQELGTTWDRITSMRSFPFEDDWKMFSGHKFFISIYPEGTFLCLGKFNEMFKYWKEYKATQHGEDSDL